MHPLLLLTLTAIFSGISFAFAKMSAGRAHPLIMNVLFAVTGLLVQGTALWYALKVRGIPFQVPWGGVWTALAGGLVGGLYVVFLFLTFSNTDLTRATPFIYVGSLAVVTIIGILFLGEELTTTRLAGLLLAAGSIALLAR